MKTFVFLVTVVIQFFAAAGGFFLLIIGLNGFSGKQAEPGLVFYIVLAVVSALGLGAASAYAARKLAAKPALGNFGASVIAVVAFAVLGIVILIIGLFAAALLAEALRK